MDQKERKAETRRRNLERGKGKGKGKGKKKSVMFACLEDEEIDPRNEEIPGNGVNVDYRHINLANVLGSNDWGRKNWEKECSSIIDAGFNGGGLCSSSRMNRYGGYLRSFYPKENYIKGVRNR